MLWRPIKDKKGSINVNIDQNQKYCSADNFVPCSLKRQKRQEAKKYKQRGNEHEGYDNKKAKRSNWKIMLKDFDSRKAKGGNYQ